METADHYLCPQGKAIPFNKVFNDHRTGTKKKEYRARKHVCTDCPIRSACLGKSAQEKKFSVTYYREEYERNIQRVESPQGRYMKGKRQSTVEPVFGTLTQFMGLRKINTIGLAQANKVMHLSAIAYNIKKYLKFEQKRSKSGAGKLTLTALVKRTVQSLFGPSVKLRKLTFQYDPERKKPFEEAYNDPFFDGQGLVPRLPLLYTVLLFSIIKFKISKF
ncbi:transposase [Maribacter sp. 4G9]|uniref:transposase n=1 Tax=Maribacter sp. 4G9 TaxID=1889777 RepID=UPI0021CE7ADB|nr:transposase [Maribacter sp. 4G9]